MGSNWRLQRIREELLLDLINQHHLTIDDVVDMYATSKTKLYEYFKDIYHTTPGKWRKQYWRGVHYAARFYTTAFTVSVCETFQDQRIGDDCYIDPPYHEEDAPMLYRVVRVSATIDGKLRAFETNRTLHVDRWENIHARNGSYTLSIRLSRGGRHPTVTAHLSLGSHLGGQLTKPYTLDVTVSVSMVGYDNSVLAPKHKELPVPEDAVMNPIDAGAEFDLAERSVYLLKLGRQILLLGLHEPIGDAAKDLHPRWQKLTLNNALRQKIRMAFHTGEYITVLLKEAIAMQARVIALMDEREGVLVCWFRMLERRYLVSLDVETDLTDLTAVYRYMDGTPSLVGQSDIDRIARNNNATVATLPELSLLLRKSTTA